jgi:molybdopterin-containing oxidoreductase family membrane subunit
MSDHAPGAPPWILGRKTLADVTADVARPLERKPSRLWKAGFALSLFCLAIGVVSIGYLFMTGIGVWGLNRTVGWAFDITNFVFWVGIGHAGTLISAVLLLFRQRWRTSVNRSAEAMTIFAVMCAGIFPLIHMGRPWFGYWVFPYPNTRGSLWVNFRSPLLWDVFAIGTYFTISLVFWFVGLVPDLATLRDRALPGLKRRIYGALALGWSGSAKAWQRHEALSLLLAGLATPLVLSVHSVVSFDFATSVLPGWHATIFPPYFVAGAVFSGFGMVLTLLLVARKVMGLEQYVTRRHIDVMCKVLLSMGMLVGLAYATEFFMAWWSGHPYERFAFLNRAFGPLGWAYAVMVGCNVVVPQLLWSPRIRNHLGVVFVITILVNVGMWFERFVIIVSSLERDFLPSSWATFSPTLLDIGTFVGSFGLFFTLFLLFCRFVPVIAISEVKAVVSHEMPRPAAGTPGHPVGRAAESGVVLAAGERGAS